MTAIIILAVIYVLLLIGMGMMKVASKSIPRLKGRPKNVNKTQGIKQNG